MVFYREFVAIFESLTFYIFHAVWDIDGCQTGAAFESRPSYACHALRDDDGCQI
jgi:hypothetical protein